MMNKNLEKRLEMIEKNKKRIIETGLTIGKLGLITSFFGIGAYLSTKEENNSLKIQKDYIDPYKIEIVVANYDKTRPEKETYLRIDKSLYTLKYDENGKVELKELIKK